MPDVIAERVPYVLSHRINSLPRFLLVYRVLFFNACAVLAHCPPHVLFRGRWHGL